jgi:hypothetical protein
MLAANNEPKSCPSEHWPQYNQTILNLTELKGKIKEVEKKERK